MKEKLLGEVSPYCFENNLIISLSNQWLKVFDGSPVFSVVINNKGRLLLVGPRVCKSQLGQEGKVKNE